MTAPGLSLALAVLAALGPGTVAAAPLEPDAIYTSDWTPAHAQELADEASALIVLYGYRCDSVSTIRAWMMSAGFTVVCNDFRYNYEIEDRGGTWVVTLE